MTFTGTFSVEFAGEVRLGTSGFPLWNDHVEE
jgi:hypothetical protein